MPTCSQAKILTNLESGIQKRAQLKAINNSNETNEFATERDDFCTLNIDRKSPVQSFPRGLHTETKSHRILNTKKPRRRISIDELQTNQFEPNQQKILHKVPIVFDDNLKKGSYVLNNSTVPPSFLYNSQYNKSSYLSHPANILNQQKINSLRTSLKLKQAGGSDGEADLSHSSEEYNSDKSSGDWLYNQQLLQQHQQKQRPTARRSIDFGHLKKISPEDTKMFLATRVQETQRRNSLLNQNQNVLSTHFPKIALEIESTVDDDMQTVCGESEHHNQQQLFNSFRQQEHPQAHKELVKREQQSLNAKRLLALASIRPSITFHKSMTADEIQVLKKYYELLKPKIPLRHSENKSDEEEHHPTLMYDTTKLRLVNLQNLKTFLVTHKKAIDSGEVVVDYDVDNDGAPAGFVLRQSAGEKEIVTKFPADTNDAFFAFTCINGTEDKVEAKLGEANLFRVLNWNDTTALCDTAVTVCTL